MIIQHISYKVNRKYSTKKNTYKPTVIVGFDKKHKQTIKSDYSY